MTDSPEYDKSTRADEVIETLGYVGHELIGLMDAVDIKRAEQLAAVGSNIGRVVGDYQGILRARLESESQ